MTLGEFLLARFEHDETRATVEKISKEAIVHEYEGYVAVKDKIHRGEPVQVSEDYVDGWIDALDFVMRELALRYVSHPDYRNEFRV
jgi:hypothetical protein